MASQRAWLFLQRSFTSAASCTRLPVAEICVRRNAMFSQEYARQRAMFPLLEKIEVMVQGPGQEGTLLIVNKGVTTPLTCAQHLTEFHVNNSALALVDGKPWHLHQPLTHSCSLNLLTFRDADPSLVNQAYWRSCSALLGQVLETAFKDNLSVELLPSPDVPVSAGAFCCDVLLDPELDFWTPSQESLHSLTTCAMQFIQQDLAWEPLEVAPSVAREVFTHSRCKQVEVEQIAAESSSGTVTLYRCGDHILLSAFPLIARTGLCSQFEITALHNLGKGVWGLHRRVQGVSLPQQLQAHHTVWKKLRKRAGRLVEIPAQESVTPLVSSHSASPPPS